MAENSTITASFLSNMAWLEEKIVFTPKQYGVPTSLITSELEGVYGQGILQDLNHIMRLYDIYDSGADFYTEGANGDYLPSTLRYKLARNLINKEARFMFARPPEFVVEVEGGKVNENQQNTLQTFLNEVLKANDVSKKLLKAAKDCFIGKRVAFMLNFNEDGISLGVSPALEFIYDVDYKGALDKIICFYTLQAQGDRKQQEMYKKKYWMDNGKCHFSEELYDGQGSLKETLIPDTATLFDYIPAVVVVNDGLTGDLQGCSEIEDLAAYEAVYSKMANADIDAEKKGMNPIRYTMDVDRESTKKGKLSYAPGSFWDLATDSAAPENVSGTAGVLESALGYAQPLDATLKRVKSTMFEQLDMPDTSSEGLQGIVTSGKTFKALYWGLMTRCDEKMLEWQPALEFMAKAIIDGALLYPESGRPYQTESLPKIKFDVVVNNQYPILQDEIEEKSIDILRVNSKTMSRKTYIKKWGGLTDDEAEDELQQIALETELLENSFAGEPPAEVDPVIAEPKKEPTE